MTLWAQLCHVMVDLNIKEGICIYSCFLQCHKQLNVIMNLQKKNALIMLLAAWSCGKRNFPVFHGEPFFLGRSPRYFMQWKDFVLHRFLFPHEIEILNFDYSHRKSKFNHFFFFWYWKIVALSDRRVSPSVKNQNNFPLHRSPFIFYFLVLKNSCTKWPEEWVTWKIITILLYIAILMLHKMLVIRLPSNRQFYDS